MGLKVKATRRGHYGTLMEPGSVFELADEAHLASWMDPVDEKDRARLAERLKKLSAGARPSAAPGTPATTGPGFFRDPVVPKAPEKPVAPAKEPPKDPPKA